MKARNDAATVIGAGITVFEALKAYDQLQKIGISIRVIDLYSLQPIDSRSLLRCARDTKRIITVEDHYAAGGIGDAVATARGRQRLHGRAALRPRDSAQRHAGAAGRSLRHFGAPYRCGGGLMKNRTRLPENRRHRRRDGHRGRGRRRCNRRRADAGAPKPAPASGARLATPTPFSPRPKRRSSRPRSIGSFPPTT